MQPKKPRKSTYVKKVKDKTKLTPGEWIVVQEYVRGYSVRKIASIYGMHESSIYAHISRIKEKLKTVNFLQIQEWVSHKNANTQQS